MANAIESAALAVAESADRLGTALAVESKAQADYQAAIIARNEANDELTGLVEQLVTVCRLGMT